MFFLYLECALQNKYSIFDCIENHNYFDISEPYVNRVNGVKLARFME